MSNSKAPNWKKSVVIGTAAAVLGLGFWSSKAFYTVSRVIDGDTFVTKEKQIIRLDSVNAPELNNCLGQEAKAEMEKLVLNKKVFIKVSYIDDMRLVASVYTLDGNVGQKMLSKGLATYATKSKQEQPQLLQTSQKARDKKIGVYSEKCTQNVNLQNPKCNIKANTTADVNYYRTPDCKYYDTTLVQLHMGDKWFCTEKEALEAGFTKGTDCSK